MRLTNGRCATVTASLNAHVARMEGSIIGPRGSIHLDEMGGGSALNGTGCPIGSHDGIASQIAELARTALYDRTNRAEAGSVLPVMRVLDAVAESLRTGAESVVEPPAALSPASAGSY